MHHSPPPSAAPKRTALQRNLEVAGIIAYVALAAWAIVHIVRSQSGQPVAYAWGYVFGGVFCALLAADFFSGVVHWAADNWGDPAWPVVGPGFIQPFRHHHVDPEDITRHGFVELNGNNCIVSLPVFWVAKLALDGLPGAAGLFWSVFCVGVAFWVLGTNQFHSWAHAPSPPRWVAALQRSGLILSKAHHDVHHVPPHSQNYCITNGWMNAPLAWLRFFPLLEWGIGRVTGVRPNHAQLALAARQGETASA